MHSVNVTLNWTNKNVSRSQRNWCRIVVHCCWRCCCCCYCCWHC